MKQVQIETQFLPPLEFFCVIKDVDLIELEYYEHYVRQSFRNHAVINTANGLHKLVVPLAGKGNRTLMKDVKIDYSQNWVNNFWRTIESAYRKSPYYEHYADDLLAQLSKRHTYLVDLNFQLLELCLGWLRWKKVIVPTKTYNKTVTFPDLRNVLLSKISYNTRVFYQPVPYTQVFGNSFVANLSIIDLIFCKGPDAHVIIDASRLNL